MITLKLRWLMVLCIALWPGKGYGHSQDLMEARNQFSKLYAQGRYQEALPFAEKAVRLGKQEFGPNHPITHTLLNNLAALYRNQGRYGDAEPLYKRSLVIWEKAVGPDHPQVATSLN